MTAPDAIQGFETVKADGAAPKEERELLLTRLFDAPGELVFKAWTDH